MYQQSDGPPIETHLIDANGLTFKVDTCGDGTRLVLCLHGFPELAFSWRYQLPLLARLGYRAWASNLRGYGRTTRPAHVADYAMDHLVADVAGLIDQAHARSVVLIAHDWGGAIAWTYALRHAPSLDRLVVMNMPHPDLFWRGVRRRPRCSVPGTSRRSRSPGHPSLCWVREARGSWASLFTRTAADPPDSRSRSWTCIGRPQVALAR